MGPQELGSLEGGATTNQVRLHEGRENKCSELDSAGLYAGLDVPGWAPLGSTLASCTGLLMREGSCSGGYISDCKYV